MQVELTEQNERFWPRWRARYRRVMDRTRDLQAFGANGRPTGKLALSVAVGRAVVRLFARDYVVGLADASQASENSAIRLSAPRHLDAFGLDAGKGALACILAEALADCLGRFLRLPASVG